MDTVHVISAIPLSKVQTNTIKSILESKLKKSVNINNSVNKSVIAGLYIVMSDKVIDTTLRTKIEKLRERLAR